MIPLLAASELDPAWLSNAFTFICAAAAVWAALFKKAPQIPQPVITRKDNEYATAEGVRNLSGRVESVDDDVKELREEIHAREKALSKDAETRAAEIYKALNDRLLPLSQALHDLAGQVKEIANQVHLINSRQLNRSERKS